jgi:hypothetical protein
MKRLYTLLSGAGMTIPAKRTEKSNVHPFYSVPCSHVKRATPEGTIVIDTRDSRVVLCGNVPSAIEAG